MYADEKYVFSEKLAATQTLQPLRLCRCTKEIFGVFLTFSGI